MTARTTTIDAIRKDWVIQYYPMITNEIIYKGSTVMLNNTSRHAFTNDWVTNSLVADDIFAGIAVETADSTDITAWEEWVRVFRKGSFLLEFTDTLDQWDVGSKVYVNNTSDDGWVTITTDSWVDVEIWEIVEFVSANLAYVSIKTGEVAA